MQNDWPEFRHSRSSIHPGWTKLLVRSKVFIHLLIQTSKRLRCPKHWIKQCPQYLTLISLTPFTLDYKARFPPRLPIHMTLETPDESIKGSAVWLLHYALGEESAENHSWYYRCSSLPWGLGFINPEASVWPGSQSQALVRPLPHSPPPNHPAALK